MECFDLLAFHTVIVHKSSFEKNFYEYQKLLFNASLILHFVLSNPYFDREKHIENISRFFQ